MSGELQGHFSNRIFHKKKQNEFNSQNFMQLIKEMYRHGQYAMNNKLCEDTRKQRNKENYYFHSNNKFLSNYWSVNRNAGLHSYG